MFKTQPAIIIMTRTEEFLRSGGVVCRLPHGVSLGRIALM